MHEMMKYFWYNHNNLYTYQATLAAILHLKLVKNFQRFENIIPQVLGPAHEWRGHQAPPHFKSALHNPQ